MLHVVACGSCSFHALILNFIKIVFDDYNKLTPLNLPDNSENM